MRTAEFTPRARSSARNKVVTVHAQPDGGAGDEVVLGLVTPKRMGAAVARNRARRRTRVLVAQLARDGLVPAGRYIVVFTAAPPDAPGEFRELLVPVLRGAAGRPRR